MATADGCARAGGVARAGLAALAAALGLGSGGCDHSLASNAPASKSTSTAAPAPADAASAAASGSKAARPAREVGVVEVAAQAITAAPDLPGRTVAYLSAEIRPQVGGIVLRRAFTEGATVRAGQLLYLIDPAPFEATHASAAATVQRAESAVNAAAVLAQRNAELVRIDAISRQVDEASQAALHQARAELAVARAAESAARIQLDRTKVVAPIGGHVGLSAVSPGALVSVGQAAALTSVQQLDPIHVDIAQSSAELLELKRQVDDGELERRGDAVRVRLRLENGAAYPHEGRLTFSGVSVNPATGAVTLRAVVPNPQRLLMPGMYVRAVLEAGVQRRALLVPQRAVSRDAAGKASVLTVDDGDRVNRKALEVGRNVGSSWHVLSGLAVGERVIVDGGQRVKPGDKVRAVTAR